MKVQLFCLPYAGGNASVFETIAKHMESPIEVIPFEYAGHGNRRKEPFYQRFCDMVDDVERMIEEQLDKDCFYGVLGYSMGSLVVYELCRRLQSRGQKMPDYLFFCAHEAPGIPFPGKDFSLLSEDEFVEKLIAFGGMAEQMRTNMRMRSLFLPPVRADYHLLHDYTYQKSECKFPGKNMIFYAQEDTPMEKVKPWQEHLEEECQFVRLGKHHFFIKEHSAEMAQAICNLILSDLQEKEML